MPAHRPQELRFIHLAIPVGFAYFRSRSRSAKGAPMASADSQREGAVRRLKVFVSYARRDIDFADRVADALAHNGLDVLIDRRDLPLLERWQEELRRLIRTSDVTVAVLTPSFLQSRWCEWEVEQVTLLRKRLAPVVAAAQ